MICTPRMVNHGVRERASQKKNCYLFTEVTAFLSLTTTYILKKKITMDQLSPVSESGGHSEHPTRQGLRSVLIACHSRENFSIFLALDHDLNADESEEKSRLIAQVLELQNTLDGMISGDSSGCDRLLSTLPHIIQSLITICFKCSLQIYLNGWIASKRRTLNSSLKIRFSANI